ncbi:hypothetical protein LCGC14_2946250 [marine sediment metagenome]|uniref:Uncharacterized protein n=1 Tax=marine sediment metagenome TaxID=412755 RepID=A0A0F9A7R9_9ZZZZ
MTYTVEAVACRFRIKNGRKLNFHTQGVVLRWLRRGTDRLVNGPSLRLETDYDPSLRQWYLYASADSVVGDAPRFLEDVNVAEIQIPR